MSILPTNIRRPAALLKIPELLAKGLSPSGIIKEFKSASLSYRRATMLQDIRNIAGIEAKKDTAKYIRRDRKPTSRSIAEVRWESKQGYMYRVEVSARDKDTDELVKKTLNVRSKELLSPQEVEEQAYEAWSNSEKYGFGEVESVKLEAVFHNLGVER
jgi:hypothetical protein